MMLKKREGEQEKEGGRKDTCNTKLRGIILIFTFTVNFIYSKLMNIYFDTVACCNRVGY